MIELVIPILMDALLYAGISVVMSLGSREFYLYNLAGGAWVVVGGWCTSLLVSAACGSPNPARAGILWVFAVLFLVQVLAPARIWESLREGPLGYLFMSLGIALLAIKVGGNKLLTSFGSSIPTGSGRLAYSVFLLVLALCCVTVWWVGRSARWAQLVIRFRTGQDSRAVKRGLRRLVALENLLLLLIGGASYFIHKGVFGSAEYRTVIPVLALVASQGRPLLAAVVSLLVSLASHMLVAGVPTVGTVSLSGYSRVLAILILLGIVLWRSWPTVPRNAARSVKRVTARMESWVPSRDALLRSEQFGIATFAILVAALVVSVRLWPTAFTQEDLANALRVASFAAVAGFAARYLGVLSLNWLTIGVMPIYIYCAANANFVLMALVILGHAILSLVFLWSMRILRSDPALLVDLALLTCIHHFIENTPAFSGAHGIVIFNPRVFRGFEDVHWHILQVMVFLAVACISLLLMKVSRMRSITLGLANFQLGLFHGKHVKTLFTVASGMLVALAVISSLANYGVLRTLSTGDINLETGLAILLVGYLMSEAGLAVGCSFALLVFGFLGSTFAGHGMYLGVVMGVSYVVAGLLIGGRSD